MSQTKLDRRRLIAGMATTLVAPAWIPQRSEAQSSFSFVHITDTHIQPELRAKEGVRKAFDAIRVLPEKPEFALVGGDIVMDVNVTDRKRAEGIYDLWQEAAASLGIPVHYSVGNHDAFALGGPEKLPENHPDFGKKWWMKRLGLSERFGSFEKHGWRFVMLDSVRIDGDGNWWGELDSEQLTWLDDLLRKSGDQPMVFLTHIPLMTIHGLYTGGTTQAMTAGTIVKNGKAVQEMIRGKNVKAVLQGHTHVVEECAYLGTRYITGGAVCGEWWKGPRLGVHPEGFGVVTVRGNELTYRYVSYGWKASL
ncbi:MAG: metallophosphoesterase [Capsulimonadales bacterium]|nr:metallophosphoesterase [Capsulimonadales bacterium]